MNTIQVSEKKRILEGVLRRNQILANRFSLDGYKEEAVCMESYGKRWIVYEGERGKRHNTELCSEFEVAGYRLISRLSESDEIEKNICASYLTSIVRYKRVAANSGISKREQPGERTRTRTKRRKKMESRIAGRKKPHVEIGAYKKGRNERTGMVRQRRRRGGVGSS